MKRGLAELVAVLFVSFASLAYGAERPVRIAYPGISIGAMVPALAIDKGFFQQEGLQVEFIVMPTSTGITALIGEVDYSTTASSAIGAAVRGLPVKILRAASLPRDRSTKGNQVDQRSARQDDFNVGARRCGVRSAEGHYRALRDEAR
jgi:ABC-type nitrate/sulfonate/bicarbonate transport system substrate-binding protein